MYENSISERVTPTVTLPPDLTQLGRMVYDALRQRVRAAGGRPVLAPHRALAEELDCSAAAIPRHMRALEDAGVIIRRPYKNKFLISLAPPDSIADRSLIESAAADPVPPPAADDAMPDSAAECDEPAEAQPIDHFLHNGTHDSCQEEESARACVSTESDQAARPWLAQHPQLNLTTIPRLIRAGIAPGEFGRVVRIKRRDGAARPIGAAVRAVLDAAAVGVRDWASWVRRLEDGDGERRGARDAGGSAAGPGHAAGARPGAGAVGSGVGRDYAPGFVGAPVRPLTFGNW